MLRQHRAISLTGSQPAAPPASTSVDDAFGSGSLVGRMMASSTRVKKLIAERDCALRQVDLLQRRLAKTSEGRVMALIGELARL